MPHFDAVEIEGLSGPAIRALSRLADLWRLDPATMASLLALPLDEWQQTTSAEEPGILSQDQLTRASLLVGIFHDSRLLFSKAAADGFVHRLMCEGPLEGTAPLQIMQQDGIAGMMRIRRYLVALLAG